MFPFSQALARCAPAIVCLLIALGSGCATPRIDLPETGEAAIEAEGRVQRLAAVESMADDRVRLANASFPVLRHAAGLDPDRTTFRLGLLLVTADSFGEDLAEAARERYALAGLPTVLSIAPESPVAGRIDVGDRLVAVSGEDLAGERWQRQLRTALDRSAGTPIELTVERNGTPTSIEVTSVEVIADRVVMSPSRTVNAYADGRKIVVHRGMIEFLSSDAELAFIVAHELAHNLLHHQRATLWNYGLGSIADVALMAATGVFVGSPLGVANALRHSARFEQEADHAGLYLLARAGVDPESVGDIWRRFARASPGSIEKRFLSTHPDSAQRSVAHQAAVREVRTRMEAGEALIPPGWKPTR